MPSYLEDIFDQPAALQATIDHLAVSDSLENYSRKLAAGAFRRVLLTGMGSSYHALHPLELRLVRYGLEVHRIETSELIHYATSLIEPHTLILAVSQSGASAETVQLLDLTRNQSPVIGVTNTSSSNLAEQAQTCVLTQAGLEASVSCKTYVSTLGALSWVGDQLIGDRKEAQFPSLARTPDLIAQYLQGYPSYIDQLATLLDSVRSIFLVGRGISLASAGTGGLIIKEAARFPAEGMSSAAFRHGPFEMASPQVFVLVYAGLRQTVDLNERLAAAIRLVGGGAQIVSPEAPFEVFRLASSQPASLPILEILPAQMISLSLAALQGMEPGRFERASKVTTVE